MAETKGYCEDLRKKLDEYRTTGRERPMTMSALGRELGVSSTRVNKYLTGKPEGNVAELEARVADMLKAASRRQVTDVTPFQSNVTATLHTIFELVRKTNDVGLVSGPAGIGKSVAIRMYCDANPTAIAICIPRWQRTDSGLVALLFAGCDTTSWDQKTPRGTYMAARLRNSNRLILVDNAHRLTAGAREWLFDFYDETGCPIVLLGNPEILDAIRRNDQQFSRIGIHQKVELDPKKVREYAKNMIAALVPEPQDGLLDLAVEVAQQRGHLRALKKQLLLSQDLAGTATYDGDQLRAFAAAHSKLVRDYEL
jgi:hypothetical protein